MKYDQPAVYPMAQRHSPHGECADYLKLETDFEHDIREDLDMFRKRYLETIAEDPEPPVWKALDQFEMTFSQ